MLTSPAITMSLEHAFMNAGRTLGSDWNVGVW